MNKISEPLKKEDIVGLWEIEAFSIISPTNDEKLWAKDITGTLFYSELGFMMVSLNGVTDDEQDKILFYSGYFEIIDNSDIAHDVLNASDPSRVGRRLIRDAQLDNSVLTLEGRGGYGRAKLKWRKK